MSRLESPPVISSRRSASVDLPWSMWATIEKLRILSMGTAVMRRGLAPMSGSGKAALGSLCRDAAFSQERLERNRLAGRRQQHVAGRYRRPMGALGIQRFLIPPRHCRRIRGNRANWRCHSPNTGRCRIAALIGDSRREPQKTLCRPVLAISQDRQSPGRWRPSASRRRHQGMARTPPPNRWCPRASRRNRPGSKLRSFGASGSSCRPRRCA